MLQNATPPRKSAPWPPNIMSLVLRLPRKMHLCRSSSNVPSLPSFLEMLQNPHVLLTFDKVHNPLRLPRKATSEPSKVVRACGVLYILTWKRASRHSGIHFLNISTSKSAPRLTCFAHFDLEMCFGPQRRALFRHLNFQKCSEGVIFSHWARRRRVIWFWKWQPLAATRVAASGRKWPPAFSCNRQPLAATCSRQHSLVTGSHLQPLAATRVAASGHKWPQVAASGRQHSLLSGSHSSGRKWPQVAAWHPPTETFPHFPRLTHGNFSTFSAANPHSERQGKTHNENARVPTKRKERQLRGKTYQKRRTTLQRKKRVLERQGKTTTKTHEFKRKGRRSN